MDSTGNLYGTTYYGGTSGKGVLFKLAPSGNETVLHNFTGHADGAWPAAALVFDPAGNLYGTSSNGSFSNDSGAVFKVNPAGNFTVLHTFISTDGTAPNALVLDAAGNLFGSASGPAGAYGIVYMLDPAGHETVLHTFAAVRQEP